MRDDANPSTEGDVSSEIDITHQTRTSRVEEGIGANDTSEGFNMDTHIHNKGSIPTRRGLSTVFNCLVCQPVRHDRRLSYIADKKSNI